MSNPGLRVRSIRATRYSLIIRPSILDQPTGELVYKKAARPHHQTGSRPVCVFSNRMVLAICQLQKKQIQKFVML
jgi:hypothetical protein